MIVDNLWISCPDTPCLFTGCNGACWYGLNELCKTDGNPQVSDRCFEHIVDNLVWHYGRLSNRSDILR